LLGTLKEEGSKDITLCRGPSGEFAGGLVYQGLNKALETGIFLHRGTIKYHGRGLFTGNSER